MVCPKYLISQCIQGYELVYPTIKWIYNDINKSLKGSIVLFVKKKINRNFDNEKRPSVYG